MNNHTEKLALLLGKFDDGQISDFELTELSNLIDSNGDAITSNIDNLLSNITPELSQSQLDFMDNYLDNLNNNFATPSNSGNNQVINNVNNPSNLLTTTTFNGLHGFSLNSSIIGFKISSILTSIGVLSLASVAYFSFNWNNDDTNKYNQYKTTISNSKSNNSNVNIVNEYKIEKQTNTIFQNETADKNLESKSNEIISNQNTLMTNSAQFFTKEEKIVYSEELVSLINQNNSKINELIIKLKNNLENATEQDNKLQQSNVLYQLGVIYRVKNISLIKSVELLNKAKEISLSSKTNLNLVHISDIYGELYKSNKLLNNNDIAEENLNNCLRFLNQAKSSNNKNINNITNKLEYWQKEIRN